MKNPPFNPYPEQGKILRPNPKFVLMMSVNQVKAYLKLPDKELKKLNISRKQLKSLLPKPIL